MLDVIGGVPGLLKLLFDGVDGANGGFELR